MTRWESTAVCMKSKGNMQTMTEQTKKRADKVAALSMIALTAEETQRLEREIPEILALRDALAEGRDETDPFADSRTPAQLREDSEMREVTPQALLALSKKERDGYLQVVRTVG